MFIYLRTECTFTLTANIQNRFRSMLINYEKFWDLSMLCLFSLLFVFYPSFNVLISKSIAPSLFVSYAYLQITATIGTMALDWPDNIRLQLSYLRVANFDVNLMGFDCHWKPSYVNEWIVLQMLPLFYWCFAAWGQVNG